MPTVRRVIPMCLNTRHLQNYWTAINWIFQTPDFCPVMQKNYTCHVCFWLTRRSPYKSLCYGHIPTRARRIVEWTLGMYCRIFHRPIDVKPDFSDIIKAYCVLQNYIRKSDCIQFDDSSYECSLESVQPVGTRSRVRGKESISQSISLRHKHQFPGSMVNCNI